MTYDSRNDHEANKAVRGPDRPEAAAEEEDGRKGRPRPALASADIIFTMLTEGTPSIFLDYDGTLTPIVSRPALAALPERMRKLLCTLAGYCPVAVVSGRDLADVRKMVGLDGLVYIGSHGFEVAGQEMENPELERATDFLPALDAAEDELRISIGEVEGAWIERKRFAVALHYRAVLPEDLPLLESILDGIMATHRELKKTCGKKVFELRPDLDWGKGKMVMALLDRLSTGGPRAVPLYLGDDLTDEDAFRAIGDDGITVLVGDGEEATAAGYFLRDVGEVETLLERLIERFALSEVDEDGSAGRRTLAAGEGPRAAGKAPPAAAGRSLKKE